MKETKPLPCPFCGSSDVVLASSFGPDHGAGRWQMSCRKCGAQGPTSNTFKNSAILRWNKRVKA